MDHSLTRWATGKSQWFSFAHQIHPVSFCAALLLCSGSIGLAAAGGLDPAKIESITGLKGVLNGQENTFKVSKPRNDVPISVDQARLAPFMGLTSWAAFALGMKDDVMMMGDMVLFEDEVNPVMSVALNTGLEVTALHNHFFFDEPKVYFMHIGGEHWPPVSREILCPLPQRPPQDIVLLQALSHQRSLRRPTPAWEPPQRRCEGPVPWWKLYPLRDLRPQCLERYDINTSAARANRRLD
jgi:hypothetical protein